MATKAQRPTTLTLAQGELFKGTWLGRPGIQITQRLAGGRTGLRSVIHQWTGEYTVRVRLVDGDATRGTLVEYYDADGVEPGAAVAITDEWREQQASTATGRMAMVPRASEQR